MNSIAIKTLMHSMSIIAINPSIAIKALMSISYSMSINSHAFIAMIFMLYDADIEGFIGVDFGVNCVTRNICSLPMT